MKMFKKLMAVALVAVMALSMFTACGTSSSKVKDAIEDKTKLEESSDLEKNEYFAKAVEYLKDDDNLKKSDNKTDVKDAFKKALSKAGYKDDVKTANKENWIIVYAVEGNADDLVSDIKSDINGYNYYAVYTHNGGVRGCNGILVIASKTKTATVATTTTESAS